MGRRSEITPNRMSQRSQCRRAASDDNRGIAASRPARLLEPMSRRTAIVVAAVLLAAVVAWNAVAVSLWSLFAAVAVLMLILYELLVAHFEAHGLVAGQPISRSGKWLLALIGIHTVLGIAYSVYKHVL